MPPQPKTRIIVDILEEHLEELAFLAMQRRGAIVDPAYLMRNVAELDERIEAHVQGLLVGADATVALAEPRLAAEDSWDAFAAAYALLRLKSPPAVDSVLAAFREAEGPALDGIREALCLAASDAALQSIREMADSAAAPCAVAAAEVLACRGVIEPTWERLADLLQDSDPAVRCLAWRIVAILGG